MNLLDSRLRLRIAVTLLLAFCALGGTRGNATTFTINLSGTSAVPTDNVITAPPSPVATGQPNWKDVPAGTGGTGGTMYVGQINDKVTDSTYHVINSMKKDPTYGMSGYNNASATVSTAGVTTFSSQSGAAVTLSQLPIVTINSVSYYEFVVDFKIANAESATGTVMTALQIYAGSAAGGTLAGTVSSTGSLGNLGTKIYDIGANSVTVSAIQNTSNISQLGIYIPVASFGVTSGTSNVYIYTSFSGLTASNDQVNVAYDTADNGFSVTVTPEAHTVWGGLSIGLLLFGGYVRQRLTKAKAGC